MFTVKLLKGHNTRLLQAEEVNVYPVGPITGTEPEPARRDSSVKEVMLTSEDKPKSSHAFYICDPTMEKPEGWYKGWPSTIEFFDVAYIMNEEGTTVEAVKAYQITGGLGLLLASSSMAEQVEELFKKYTHS